jgi:hypothetical protein
MIGHDRTVRAAMRELFLFALGLHPQQLAKWVDCDLTHTNVPPALRRVPSLVRLSALDQAAAAAADYERRIDPPAIRYIEELW